MDNYESIFSFEEKEENLVLSKKRRKTYEIIYEENKYHYESNNFVSDFTIEKENTLLSSSENVINNIDKEEIEEDSEQNKWKELKKEVKEKDFDANIKIKSLCIQMHTESNLLLDDLIDKKEKILIMKTLKLENKSLHFKMKSPPCYVKILKSGKIIAFGIKKKESCYIFIREINRILSKKNIKEITHFEVVNILGILNVGFKINLYKLGIYGCFIYDPELYSNKVLYTSSSPKMTFSIYKSGIVNISGAKSEKDIKVVYNKIYHLLKDSKM